MENCPRVRIGRPGDWLCLTQKMYESHPITALKPKLGVFKSVLELLCYGTVSYFWGSKKVLPWT
jgi:hypothetical protein